MALIDLKQIKDGMQIKQTAEQTATELESAKTEIDSLNTLVTEVAGTISTLTTEIETVDTKVDAEIARAEAEEEKIKTSVEELRGLISNHSKTVVVETIDEITTAIPEPVVGDLAYVIDIKRSYIYKGEETVATFDLPTPPAGWVLFDELSNIDVDLADYLKTADADAKFRLKTQKVAEAELEDALKAKIDAKANASSVYTKAEVDAKVKVTDDKVVALTPRVVTLEAAKAEVPQQISSANQALETKLNATISSLRSKVEANYTAISTIETALEEIEATKTKVVSTSLKGNQAITLDVAPVQGSEVELYVNGVKYKSFTTATANDVFTITWTGPFTLDAEDDIEVVSTVLDTVQA